MLEHNQGKCFDAVSHEMSVLENYGFRETSYVLMKCCLIDRRYWGLSFLIHNLFTSVSQGDLMTYGDDTAFSIRLINGIY